MTRIRIVQGMLIAAVFFAGTQVGMQLSDYLRDQVPISRVVLALLTAFLFAAMLMTAIVKPERYGGKKD